MLKRLLSCCVLVMCFIFPSFADDECPAGYGYTTLVNATVGGCVDLGTLDWRYTRKTFMANISDVIHTSESSNAKLYVSGYQYLPPLTIWNNPDDYNLSVSTNEGISDAPGIMIRNFSYTDATAFKQAMSGVILYYQRATDESWTPPSENTVCQFDTSSYEPYGEYILPEMYGCTMCPLNTYKDFVGNTECMPCPNGTMSPAGAKSADECGHILHVGDYIAFMPVGKRTEHGLCTMLGGVKYCADLYERQ